jgi:hypothetical protein
MLVDDLDGLVEHAALEMTPHAARAIPATKLTSRAPQHDFDTGCDLSDDSAGSAIGGQEFDHCSGSLTNFARRLTLKAREFR